MTRRLGWFEAIGIELEYMIVNAESLDVAPVCDRIMRSVTGDYASEVEMGEIAWSNELALHVVELKTNGPAPSLDLLPHYFDANVYRVNDILSAMRCRIMPTAMHPWMDPLRETRLWPHENGPIYEAYHRIFDCRGHGWANLQSAHLNLPFDGDDQFGRLHTAIRLLLPLLPALAASSPIVEGRHRGLLDHRLEAYRFCQARIPVTLGAIIPEPVVSEAEYRDLIFRPIDEAMADLDTDGVLWHEFLNSRGAIARFSRGSIEIRLLDVQECPAADVAIAELVVAVLRALCDERWSSYAAQRQAPTALLSALLLQTRAEADQALVVDSAYGALFGLALQEPITAGDFWRRLADRLTGELAGADGQHLGAILEHGPLARRILRALPEAFDRGQVHHVYERLCECLALGQIFEP